ncbi:MAG: hypothetical protein D6701_10455 [Gemmatimonadetes bacterium]|nr:MAG: hypothetical protein D6701_10455 [Gemmatimonadota bacterium]
MRTLPVLFVSVLSAGLAAGCAPSDEAPASAEAAAVQAPAFSFDDPDVQRIYTRMMQVMAPDDGWARTRYVQFDWIVNRPGAPIRRSHRYDVWGGRYRVEFDLRDGSRFVAVSSFADPSAGRAWIDGEEVTDPERLAELLDMANGAFINDSYWILMPYKWADPGVHTRYLGEVTHEDGRTFEAVELTFDSVGRTPQNKYHAFVNPETGLMERWYHFRNADDPEPSVRTDWSDWQRFGPIMLSTDRPWEGQSRIYFENVRADTVLDEALFAGPEAEGAGGA